MKLRGLLIELAVISTGLVIVTSAVVVRGAAAPGQPGHRPDWMAAADQLTATSVYTIDATGQGGLYTSLAIVDGNPAIAYLNPDGTPHLKYARASDVSGSTWGTSLTVDTTAGSGQFASLAVVNGDPAIAYYTGRSKTPNYVRAGDADGATWGVTRTVDDTGDVGMFASLAVVDGRPAIAYFDNSTAFNGHLKYVRAMDANGTAWGAPLTIDSAGDTGWYASLQVVNGKPAVAYFDLNNGGHLRYIRAADVDGTSWRITHTLDSQVIATLSARLLVIVNGNPAVAYGDASSSVNGHLKFVRATDANGDTWGTPLPLDIMGNAGYFPSPALINNVPTIAYCDNTSHVLKVVQALDANGTAWAIPITMDSGQLNEFSSLAEVNGTPGIVYEDYSGVGSLQFEILTLPPPHHNFLPLLTK